MRAMEFFDMLINNLDDPKNRKVIEFVFLWQDYNYWYNKKNRDNPNLLHKEKPLDELQALELSNDINAIKIYDELKSSFLNEFEKIPANDLNGWKRDRLRNTGDYQVEKFYDKENDTLKDFLSLVYQLRCNFIHGGKEGDKVDIMLISWAKDCLGELLSNLNYLQD